MKPATKIKRPSVSQAKPLTSTAQVDASLKAARRHRASVKKFVESGQVEDAAREAEPKTPVEEVEMFDAERVGEGRSKGEDESLGR
jgi:hypothetical protein